MRKVTFIASVLFFLVIITAICTGTWKDISIAKESNEDMNIVVQVDDDILQRLKPPKKVDEVQTTFVAVENKDFSRVLEEKSKSKKNNKSLFIGDSRTVGIAEYASIKNADFYANVGLSVYNVFKEKAQVKGTGKIGIEKMLSLKKYGKVYLMIGINELGYNFNKTVSKYQDFVNYIRNKQPDAKIIIQANLHVTKARAKGDSIINNKMINRYNRAISAIADNENIFYIDVNPMFDDKEGNLMGNMTSDGVHILAKYYKNWGEWIVEQTSNI